MNSWRTETSRQRRRKRLQPSRISGDVWRRGKEQITRACNQTRGAESAETKQKLFSAKLCQQKQPPAGQRSEVWNLTVGNIYSHSDLWLCFMSFIIQCNIEIPLRLLIGRCRGQKNPTTITKGFCMNIHTPHSKWATFFFFPPALLFLLRLKLSDEYLADKNLSLCILFSKTKSNTCCCAVQRHLFFVCF